MVARRSSPLLIRAHPDIGLNFLLLRQPDPMHRRADLPFRHGLHLSDASSFQIGVLRARPIAWSGMLALVSHRLPIDLLVKKCPTIWSLSQHTFEQKAPNEVRQNPLQLPTSKIDLMDNRWFSQKSAAHCHSVTKFQHCWKIRSVLFRNTVGPSADHTTPGSCLGEGLKPTEKSELL
jgi:hypothetical protein